jgi:hypothetical protein
MASLTQGNPLPNITTTQSQTTTAPSFYTDYLTNLASSSTSAGANANFVGATDQQKQAWDLAGSNVGNYQPYLDAATGQVNEAAGMSAANAGAGALNQSMGMSGADAAKTGINAAMQTAPSNVQQYMNPYMSSVVDEAGRLGLQNIRNTISPQATAGAVGSGQFGSTRGANVLGQNITGALQTLGGQQQGLLASGYDKAITASQADMARQLQAGVAAGQLTAADAQRLMQTGQIQGQLTASDIDSALKSSQQYGALGKSAQEMGLADVNALSTMGAQKQQIGQNEELFPLQLAEKQANIMKGFTVPTTVEGSYTGPIPGAYSAAPLSQIMSGASLIGALSNTKFGSGLIDLFKSDPYFQDMDWSVPNAGINAGTFVPPDGTDPLGDLINELTPP